MNDGGTGEGEVSFEFSLLICGSIARLRIAYFSGNKIDGFVTQHAINRLSVSCMLSTEMIAILFVA